MVESGDDKIDTSDIPEVEDWSGAKRGKFYKPVKREKVTLLLDADLVAWFRDNAGEDYQAKINSALRIYITHQNSNSPSDNTP